MHLPLSQKYTSRLEWRDSAGSTNLELIQLAELESLPDFTVMATGNQVAGRGRAGRVWETPADVALAISVLIRPRLDSLNEVAKFGWLPLLGGLAMTEAIRQFFPEASADLGVKWPNDVLIADQKVCGVLSELVSMGGTGDASRFGAGMAVVIGAGINITQEREQLPVETATSLSLAGASLPFDREERFDLVLSAYLNRLQHWYQKFTDAKFSAVASGLRQAVIENCVTLGRPVRAILPGESERTGTALTIDDSGRLVMESNGEAWSVAAGDIIHLRHN